MTTDMRDALEINVCEDCSTLKELDDATSFDYHYPQPEASRRINECSDGWDALHAQGLVFNDTTDAVERICSDCGHVGDEAYFPRGEDSEGDRVDICPACGSFDTSQRDDGHDEFSWSQCDCCGSRLGGSRTRYGLFPHPAEPPAAGETGPVVPEQVEGSAG